MYLKVYSNLFFTLAFFISKEMHNNQGVLDIGCGKASPLRMITKSSSSVGLDLYRSYILKCKALSIHDDYVLGDAKKLPFKNQSMDLALSVEVIEHLKKRDGLEIIEEMQRVVRKKIILTTPNGYLPAYAGSDDNPVERHESGWIRDDLEKLGFRVHGLNGMRCLWKIKQGQAVLLTWLFMPFILLTEAIVYRALPSQAFQLFCVKNLT